MITKLVENVRKAGGRVIGGMFFHASPGHMLSETDNLLRLARTHPELRRHPPIVFLQPTDMAKVAAEILAAHRIQTVLDNQAMGLLREIQLFHPDVVFDVGQAHWKLVLEDKASHPIGDLFPLNFGWALRPDEFTAQHVRLLQAWKATSGQHPIREGFARLKGDPALLDRLHENKYVVLQIKAVTGNGTIRLLSGEAYKPALGYLRDNGYSIILGGREPMLEEFRAFDVWDYPRSTFVSPRNDFFLIGNAAAGVFTPSGAGYFCDTLGVPYCQIGNWTLMPQPGFATQHLPCRLRERSSGRILGFRDQARAFVEGYDRLIGPARFDSARFEDLQPDGSQILAAVRDVLHPPPPSDQDEEVRRLDPIGMWKAACGRFAPSFLKTHPEFLA